MDRSARNEDERVRSHPFPLRVERNLDLAIEDEDDLVRVVMKVRRLRATLRHDDLEHAVAAAGRSAVGQDRPGRAVVAEHFRRSGAADRGRRGYRVDPGRTVALMRPAADVVEAELLYQRMRRLRRSGRLWLVPLCGDGAAGQPHVEAGRQVEVDQPRIILDREGVLVVARDVDEGARAGVEHLAAGVEDAAPGSDVESFVLRVDMRAGAGPGRHELIGKAERPTRLHTGREQPPADADHPEGGCGLDACDIGARGPFQDDIRHGPLRLGNRQGPKCF